jgi:solute carrier family 6 amino acid transporter-like protein 5/7/9/14
VFVATANCLTSFYSGFVVFSFIGFMAHSSGKPIEEVIVSGPGLAFVVYPEAVSRLPFPHLWSVLLVIESNGAMHALTFPSGPPCSS